MRIAAKMPYVKMENVYAGKGTQETASYVVRAFLLYLCVLLMSGVLYCDILMKRVHGILDGEYS